MNSIIEKVTETINNKKGKEIVILNLEKASPYFDILIIATCLSPIHIKTIHNEILKTLGKDGVKINYRNELNSSSGWSILDYGNFVIHLFTDEMRQRYQLEKIWNSEKR